MKRLGIFVLLWAMVLTACAAPPAPSEPAAEQTAPAEETAESPEEETTKIRLYGEAPLERLVPDDGYGTLVPYVGRKLPPPDGMDPEYLDLYWYGLATADGRVVTAPDYSLVDQLRYTALDGSGALMPMYQLWTEKFWQSDGPRLCAVAALDGSWCTEQRYLWACAVGPDRALLVDPEYRLWFCDLEGRITPTALDCPITDLWLVSFPDSLTLSSTVGLRSTPDEKGRWFVNLDTGARIYFPSASGSEWARPGELLSVQDEDGYGYIDRAGNWVLPPEYAWSDDFYGSYGLVQRAAGGPLELIDRTGQTVLFDGGNVRACVVDGAVYWVADDAEGRIAEIRDGNLQPVDLPAVGGRWADTASALSWVSPDGSRWFWDGEAVHAYPDNTLWLERCAENRALFSQPQQSGPHWYGLYDVEGGRWIQELSPDHAYLLQANGRTYLGKGSGNCYYDLDGNLICCGDWNGLPVDGVFPVVDGTWTGLVGPGGQWLLRMPLDTGT